MRFICDQFPYANGYHDQVENPPTIDVSKKVTANSNRGQDLYNLKKVKRKMFEQLGMITIVDLAIQLIAPFM